MPDVIPPQLHVADRVAMTGVTAGEAAVLAHGSLLRLTVVQAVLIVLRAGPGLDRVRLHQQMPQGRTGLLQVGLDMGLTAGGVTTEADLHGR